MNFKEKVASVLVLHRKPTRFTSERVTRFVVWATTETGKKVWVKTIEGDFDKLNVEIKVAMAQEFFRPLVGQVIEFRNGDGDAYFIDERLPRQFWGSYTGIKRKMAAWVEAHYGKKLAVIKAKTQKKRLTSRKKSAKQREQARKQRAEAVKKYIKLREARYEMLLALRRATGFTPEPKPVSHMTLVFRKGWNRKWQCEQWEARSGDVLCVLRKEDTYDPHEGAIPVLFRMELVPGRIWLVERSR